MEDRRTARADVVVVVRSKSERAALVASPAGSGPVEPVAAAAPFGRRIGAASARLLAFLGGSERIFLRTAERLEQLSGEASRAVESSSHDITLGAAGDPVDDLRGLVEQMEGHLRQTQVASAAGREGLGRIITGLERTIQTCAELRRLVSTLRAVAASLRIEDGRSEEGAGFAAVAADIVRIAGVIDAVFERIDASAASLRRRAAAAERHQRELLDADGDGADGLLAKARSSLAALALLAASIAELKTRAAESSGNIREAVQSVLVALQGHDITRQIVEHVVETLRASEADTGAQGDAAGEGVAASQDAGADDLAALLAVQARQVLRAHAQLSSAHAGIADNLRSLSAQVDTIASRTRAILAEDAGRSLVAEVEGSLTQAAAALASQLERERDTYLEVSSVAGAMADMDVFFAEITAAARDAGIVSLNASVKAVRAGVDGAVFGVLAHTLQDVSAEVAGGTRDVARIMQEVVAAARELAGAAERERGTASSHGLEARLRQMVAGLREYQEEGTVRLRRLGASHSTITREVDELSEGLRHETRAAEELRVVAGELARIGEEAAALRAASASTEPGARLKAAADRYTMETERAVHDAALGLGGESLARAGAGGASGLGVNVELF